MTRIARFAFGFINRIDSASRALSAGTPKSGADQLESRHSGQRGHLIGSDCWGDPRQNSFELILGTRASQDRNMLQLLIVMGRALALGLPGHRELVLENLALRQQLMAMKRATRRPHLQAWGWLCWIAFGASR
jgi:hypothetical protein